jgi:hypothetical protein
MMSQDDNSQPQISSELGSRARKEDSLSVRGDGVEVLACLKLAV